MADTTIVKTSQESLARLTPIAEDEGWSPRKLVKAAKQAGYKFVCAADVKGHLEKFKFIWFSRSRGLSGDHWANAIGLARNYSINSQRELLVLMRRRGIPASRHTVTEALHAAGKDGLPESRLQHILSTMPVHVPAEEAKDEEPAAVGIPADLSPAMKQYVAFKRQHPDYILFFRMGDFYELFFDDAKTAARVLGITLTTRSKGDANPIPMAGVPYHSVEQYLKSMITAGHRCALAEPDGTKKKPDARIVSRYEEPALAGASA